MKALLVIDMPSRCFGCKLHRVIDGENEFMVFCCPLRRPVNVLEERPSWCPLKPLPQKGFGDEDDIEQTSYFDGWNDCLDSITGETE